MIRPLSASRAPRGFCSSRSYCLCPRLAPLHRHRPPRPQLHDRAGRGAVLHHHRADHHRGDRPHPRRDLATGRPHDQQGRKVRPILVFEFRPGEVAPGESEFGMVADLANFISTKLRGRKRTVAYVPEPLTGYAVLAALACDEIVMGAEASLGPITPEGQAVDPLRARRGPDPGHPQGARPRPAARACSTATPTCARSGPPTSRSTTSWPRTCPSSEKTHQVVEEQPAWEGGQRGVLTGQAGPRGGVRQADRRQPRRGRRRSTSSPASRRPTTRRSARCSSRSGSRSTGRSTRSRSRTSGGGSSRPGKSRSTSSSSRSTARGGSTGRPTASPT